MEEKYCKSADQLNLDKFQYEVKIPKARQSENKTTKNDLTKRKRTLYVANQLYARKLKLTKNSSLKPTQFTYKFTKVSKALRRATLQIPPLENKTLKNPEKSGIWVKSSQKHSPSHPQM